MDPRLVKRRKAPPSASAPTILPLSLGLYLERDEPGGVRYTGQGKNSMDWGVAVVSAPLAGVHHHNSTWSPTLPSLSFELSLDMSAHTSTRLMLVHKTAIPAETLPPAWVDWCPATGELHVAGALVTPAASQAVDKECVDVGMSIQFSGRTATLLLHDGVSLRKHPLPHLPPPGLHPAVALHDVNAFACFRTELKHFAAVPGPPRLPRYQLPTGGADQARVVDDYLIHHALETTLAVVRRSRADTDARVAALLDAPAASGGGADVVPQMVWWEVGAYNALLATLTNMDGDGDGDDDHEMRTPHSTSRAHTPGVASPPPLPLDPGPDVGPPPLSRAAVSTLPLRARVRALLEAHNFDAVRHAIESSSTLLGCPHHASVVRCVLAGARALHAVASRDFAGGLAIAQRDLTANHPVVCHRWVRRVMLVVAGGVDRDPGELAAYPFAAINAALLEHELLAVVPPAVAPAPVPPGDGHDDVEVAPPSTSPSPAASPAVGVDEDVLLARLLFAAPGIPAGAAWRKQQTGLFLCGEEKARVLLARGSPPPPPPPPPRHGGGRAGVGKAAPAPRVECGALPPLDAQHVHVVCGQGGVCAGEGGSEVERALIAAYVMDVVTSRLPAGLSIEAAEAGDVAAAVDAGRRHGLLSREGTAAPTVEGWASWRAARLV